MTAGIQEFPSEWSFWYKSIFQKASFYEKKIVKISHKENI